MTTYTDQQKLASERGVVYALEYLRDLFDGVVDTDIYKDFMGEESE